MSASQHSKWLPSVLVLVLAACATIEANGPGGPDGGEPWSDAAASDAATGAEVGTPTGFDSGSGNHDASTGTPDGSSPADSGPGGGADAEETGGPEASPPLTGPVYTFGAAVNPGSCLDVLGAGTANGSQIDEYTCNTSVAQSFYVVDAGGGVVKLVNTNSNTCVDVNGGGTADGTKVQLWGCDGTPAQAFTLTATGDGFFNIVNTGSNKCLEAAGGNPANGDQRPARRLQRGGRRGMEPRARRRQLHGDVWHRPAPGGTGARRKLREHLAVSDADDAQFEFVPDEQQRGARLGG